VFFFIKSFGSLARTFFSPHVIDFLLFLNLFTSPFPALNFFIRRSVQNSTFLYNPYGARLFFPPTIHFPFSSPLSETPPFACLWPMRNTSVVILSMILSSFSGFPFSRSQVLTHWTLSWWQTLVATGRHYMTCLCIFQQPKSLPQDSRYFFLPAPRDRGIHCLRNLSKQLCLGGLFR